MKTKKMSGKIRSIGILLFLVVQGLKQTGIDLGVDQDDIFIALDLVTGAVASIGMVVSFVKPFFKKSKNV